MQIAQVQEQASGLEMQCSQLQTQVETLTQTKDVLQGRTVLLLKKISLVYCVCVIKCKNFLYIV